MTQITPQPGIMQIALYVSGESSLAGHDRVLKLSSNENPLGCSERARAAFVAAAADLHRYPATDHASLRRAIGMVAPVGAWWLGVTKTAPVFAGSRSGGRPCASTSIVLTRAPHQRSAATVSG